MFLYNEITGPTIFIITKNNKYYIKTYQNACCLFVPCQYDSAIFMFDSNANCAPNA